MLAEFNNCSAEYSKDSQQRISHLLPAENSLKCANLAKLQNYATQWQSLFRGSRKVMK